MNLTLPLKNAVPPKIAVGILDLVNYYHFPPVFSKICYAGFSNPVGSIPNPAGHSLSLT